VVQNSRLIAGVPAALSGRPWPNTAGGPDSRSLSQISMPSLVVIVVVPADAS
jgi:hypothetical protein